MRCLLDKNVVRYTIAALRYRHLRLLSRLELDALSLWRVAEGRNASIFISSASFNMLQRLGEYDEIRIFLASVNGLSATRYHARWARRIRETAGLSREDAAIVALASFASDPHGSILGSHLLITSDQPLINGYLNHLSELERRFRAMTVQLPAPFHLATLPRLATPDEMLREWAERGSRG
jgi:hypothetical protein